MKDSKHSLMTQFNLYPSLCVVYIYGVGMVYAYIQSLSTSGDACVLQKSDRNAHHALK